MPIPQPYDCQSFLQDEDCQVVLPLEPFHQAPILEACAYQSHLKEQNCKLIVNFVVFQVAIGHYYCKIAPGKFDQ